MVNLIDVIYKEIVYSSEPPDNIDAIWFDINSNEFKIYYNGEWISIVISGICKSTIPPNDTNIIWYDTINDVVKIYNGNSWVPVYSPSIIYSDTEPDDITKFWFDTVNNKLKYYNINTNIWEILEPQSIITISDIAPTNTQIIWFDTMVNKFRIYNPSLNRWDLINHYYGITFDNNAILYNYINIPISTPPTESVQYLIEINGDNINIYSNDLTTILVSGTGGLDFWNNVKSDGSDIRVSDEYCSQIYFWIEEFDYTNQLCRIWCKLEAGQTELNIWYNGETNGVSEYNNGNMAFEFFDDFETWEGWIQYGNGAISQSSDVAYNSNYSLMKSVNYDPNGGYKNINTIINRDIILEFYRYSSTVDTGGNVRIGIIDDNGNGYGYCDSADGDWIGIDIRNSYIPTVISADSITINKGVWYFSQFIICSDGTIKCNIYDININLLKTINIIDDTYNLFSKVYVFGGITYYIDNLKIRKYLSTNLTFGTPTVKTL